MRATRARYNLRAQEEIDALLELLVRMRKPVVTV
jgi:hypothetical protein